jgi:hypothetical protein
MKWERMMKRRDSTERGNAAETSGKCMEMLEKIEVNLENIEGYWKILEACLQTCNLSTKGAEFHHLARAAALTSQPQDATSPYFPSHPREAWQFSMLSRESKAE